MYRNIILPVVLYGCETWSLKLREERRLRVFENRVLRRIFGSKRDEVTGEWRRIFEPKRTRKPSSSEGPTGHKVSFSANLLSKYGILMLVKSRNLVIFPCTSLDDLLQESPP
jgi:hypothetical protein